MTENSSNKNMKTKIYEGSSKSVYISSDEYSLIQFFKDDIFFDEKNHHISGKGVINNAISAFLMDKLDLARIETHFIEKLNMREQKIHTLDVIPVQVVVTNIALGSYVENFGIQEGFVFATPMIEFRVKNSKNNFPKINESQIEDFNWASKYEIDEIKIAAKRINDFLIGYFSACGFRLLEITLEFGRIFNGDDYTIVLADEITPETFRLSDLDNNNKYDIYDSILNHPDPIEIYKLIGKRLKAIR